MLFRVRKCSDNGAVRSGSGEITWGEKGDSSLSCNQWWLQIRATRRWADNVVSDKTRLIG